MFRTVTAWARSHPRTIVTSTLMLVMLAVAGDPAAAYDSGGGSLIGLGP